MATFSDIDYDAYLAKSKLFAMMFSMPGRQHLNIFKPIPEDENSINYNVNVSKFTHKCIF